jgi:hypothetical protein
VKRRILALSLLLTAGRTGSAQGHPLAPIIFRLPGGTRALAMGNANVGGRDDDVLFYNAAQLVSARGTSASTEWYTGANMLTTLSTTLPFASGGLGLGVQSLTYTAAGATLADPRSLGGAGTVPASGVVFAAGYAQRLLGARVGIESKLVDDESGGSRDMRGAFDAGLARDMLQGTFGLALQNVGEAIRTPEGRVPMPTRATLGYQGSGQPLGPLDLAASAAVTMTRGRRVSGGLGAELGYGWIDGYTISARGGARRPADDGEGRWTAGLGFTADRLTLDYAFETRHFGQSAHRVGLRIR